MQEQSQRQEATNNVSGLSLRAIDETYVSPPREQKRETSEVVTKHMCQKSFAGRKDTSDAAPLWKESQRPAATVPTAARIKGRGRGFHGLWGAGGAAAVVLAGNCFGCCTREVAAPQVSSKQCEEPSAATPLTRPRAGNDLFSDETSRQTVAATMPQIVQRLPNLRGCESRTHSAGLPDVLQPKVTQSGTGIDGIGQLYYNEIDAASTTSTAPLEAVTTKATAFAQTPAELETPLLSRSTAAPFPTTPTASAASGVADVSSKDGKTLRLLAITGKLPRKMGENDENAASAPSVSEHRRSADGAHDALIVDAGIKSMEDLVAMYQNEETRPASRTVVSALQSESQLADQVVSLQEPDEKTVIPTEG